MYLLNKVINIFFPRLCINCDFFLLDQEDVLCVKCSHDLPFCSISNVNENHLKDGFYGRIPIERASAFLEYRKNNITQKLIHGLKYKKDENIAFFLSHWFVEELRITNFMNGIDVILPVPLHKKKLKRRGFNQVTKFGEILSETFNIDFISDVLIRIDDSKTQTVRNREERFLDLKTKFSITNTSILQGKHVLLIDDVITTGATIEACWFALSKVNNVKISVISLAKTV